MGSYIIKHISASPSLIWVCLAMGFHIVNLALGAYAGFFKRSASVIKIHQWLYYAIVFCLAYFLILNQTHGKNTLWDYLVGLYFITVIPLSKRWDVLAHAFLSLVGLTLLPLLIILQM
ncbi:MAG: hypothetical protein COV66_11370 [Nitrospinae bacterium CG11_big_fil_rev_8_21_14_0_20_45_15]|nr:MAG: hypothetical protein COV66_11370 [Nitrospinae bacterium CG11_big_fil_rev_8_21_14_0_20_45_15]